MGPEVRIAIIGGGIAGCTLANGLHQCPNVRFDVFEARAIFTERGASVGLAGNAVSALRAMGMDVDQAMENAGAMAMTSTQYLAVCVSII
jgi:salicylate hydroxylase